MTTNDSSTRVLVLVFTDIVDSLALKVNLGDADYVEHIARPYNAMFREILAKFSDAEENNYTGDGFLATFASVPNAVNAALLFHHALRTAEWKSERPSTRVGIHLGETVLFDGGDVERPLIASSAADLCSRVMSLGYPGQTLMTRAAFDSARQYVRHYPATGEQQRPDLQWMAHGKYVFQGSDEPLEVFEVGAVGIAPLKPPADSAKARSASTVEEEATLGWRPGKALAIPRRHGWTIEKRLGEGSFGEVWLARHAQTREFRVFKFCFDANRLRHFKRELAVFRLLREVLGDREDIARLLEVQLEERPFFLESEYVESGNLSIWAETRGGIGQLSFETRIKLVADVARAVGAAHSGGIIHKDIKPSNIFIVERADGSPRPVLADFGVGAIADRAILQERGISDGGFTQAATLLGDETARTGTPLYKPPESLVGKPATTAGDIYALGVLLYQMIIGDLDRPLAIGWENDVPDELLREDITACTHGDPDQRLDSAMDLEKRLETLDERRAEREAQRLAEVERNRAMERAANYKRRLRAMKISLAVVFVFVITLATLLIQINRERERAVAHRREAEDNLRQVRALVDEYFTQVSENKLLNVPGLQSLRLDLLESALVYYQGFVDRKTEGPRVEEYEDYLASAYFRLGIVKSQTGANDEAFADFQKSIEIRETLRSEHPSVPKYQSDLAVSYAYLGMLQARIGKPREGEKSLAEAVAIQRQLVEQDPDNDEHQDDMALIYHDLGLLQRETRRFDDAAASFLDAIKIRERLSRSNPDEADRLADLATSYNNLGGAQAESGKREEAANAFQKAIEVQEPLYEEHPKNTRYQHELAGSYNNLANAQRAIGKHDQAAATYARAIEIQQQLASENPLVVEYQANLATNLGNLGMLFRGQRRLDEAADLLERAIEIEQQIAAKEPQVIRYRMSLADNYRNVGILLMEQGQPDRAVASFRRAIEIQERLHAENPGVAQIRNELASSYNTLGILESEAGALVGAAAAFQKAVEFQRLLCDENPQDARHQGELAISYYNLGVLDTKTGKLVAAAASFREAALLHERLLAAGQDAARHAFELADCYRKLADCELKSGAFLRAMATVRKYFELRLAQVSPHPDATVSLTVLRIRHALFLLDRIMGTADELLDRCQRLFGPEAGSSDGRKTTSAGSRGPLCGCVASAASSAPVPSLLARGVRARSGAIS